MLIKEKMACFANLFCEVLMIKKANRIMAKDKKPVCERQNRAKEMWINRNMYQVEGRNFP